MKKIKPYIINTLIVTTILLLILIISKTSPFGPMELGKSDVIVQHKPFLYNYIMSIKTNTISNYSFNNSLGNPLLFTLIFYLASPLNLIALLFKNPDTMFLSVLLLKLALTSLTITYYTKKKNTSNLISLICTISYCFSGWYIAYYYNNMWLDIFMIFPLLQYGLECLIKDHKYLLFISSLCYMFITNFLLTPAILLYIIIYFIINNFFYKEDEIKNKLQTTACLIGCIIISTLILYLPLSSLMNTFKQTGIELFTDSYKYTTNITKLLPSLIYGNYNLSPTKDNITFPNLGMNTIILISLFYFFTNKKITLKDKLYTFISIDIILLCIFIPKIDYLSNMFYDISGITYRYAFIFNFLSIMLFIKNANNYEYDKKTSLITISIPLIILLLSFKQLDKTILIINLITIITYLIIFLFYKDNKIFKYLILITIITQTCFITYNVIPSNKEIENYNFQFQKEPIKYRENYLYVENGKEFLNQNLYANHNITYQFSYMTYQNSLMLGNSLGCEADNHIMTCNNDNKLFNMYLNIKDNYYLEKIFTVNKEVLATELNVNNVKQSQEYLVETTTGIKDIFDKEVLIPEEKNNQYHYHTDKNYFLMDDGIFNYSYSSTDFYIDVEDAKTKEINIYTLKDNKLDEIYSYLNKNQINYTHYEDNYIEGTIYVPKDQIIFTSIPYDDSWEIKIDGNIVKPSRILDSLIAIKTTEGNHTISMKYKHKNIILPATTSIISIIILITYTIIKKRKTNN